jgi:hypothetical protein
MSTETILKKWVEKMSKHALATLKLKTDITIKLEPIGERFKTKDNAAELSVSSGILFVNSDWLKSMRSNPDETEVRLLIYHEMRHVYQRPEIEKLKKGIPTTENLPIIYQWEKEFSHYQRNEGGGSELGYYKQFIEIDAYAFGIYLLNMDVQRGDKLSLDTRSIPDEIDVPLFNRIQEIAIKMAKS